MKNDYDMDLNRLFADTGEPARDEAFVERVSRRITLSRWGRRVTRVLLVGAGVVMLALLTPWVMGLTGYVALGSNIFASSIVAMVFSPVGWVLGGVAGLFAFFQSRA